MPPAAAGHRGREHHGVHPPARRVDAGGFGGRQVLLDREQREAEARALDVQRDDHADHHQHHGDQHVGALIVELHVGGGVLALHRQRDFLIAEPFEHVEHRERVGEHREREVVPAQAEGRNADQHAGDHADHGAERHADPRRDAELHERDGDGVGAEPEERRMAERDQPAVAGQHVPAEPHRGPDQHQRHHQLVIGIAHEEADREEHDREGRDRRVLARKRAALHHVRSQTRPNIPCGRKNTMTRNTTKIAVFCS